MFSAPPSEVVAALVDRAYLEAMGQLKDLGAPEVRSQTNDGLVVTQELLFRFTGKLPGAVTRVIDTAKLSWIEHDEITLRSSSCRYRMVPVHYQKFFRCQGTWIVEPHRAGSIEGSRRVIEGDMKVNSPVPFVGGQVEKAIVSGLRERLAAEPAVFDAWRTASGSGR